MKIQPLEIFYPSSLEKMFNLHSDLFIHKNSYSLLKWFLPAWSYGVLFLYRYHGSKENWVLFSYHRSKEKEGSIFIPQPRILKIYGEKANKAVYLVH